MFATEITADIYSKLVLHTTSDHQLVECPHHGYYFYYSASSVVRVLGSTNPMLLFVHFGFLSPELGLLILSLGG